VLLLVPAVQHVEAGGKAEHDKDEEEEIHLHIVQHLLQ
jgi:hypothetical protein